MSAVIICSDFGAPQKKSATVSTVSPSISHEVMGPDAMIFIFCMRNAGLEEAQAGIQIAGRNINNFRYADDTTLMAECEEELKSLLMKVKEVIVTIFLRDRKRDTDV